MYSRVTQSWKHWAFPSGFKFKNRILTFALDIWFTLASIAQIILKASIEYHKIMC